MTTGEGYGLTVSEHRRHGGSLALPLAAYFGVQETGLASKSS